jgi:hypothetical protein
MPKQRMGAFADHSDLLPMSSLRTDLHPPPPGEGKKARFRILAAHCARVLQIHSAPKQEGAGAPQKRGRREDRVRAAPAVSCARNTQANAHEHTGSAEAARPSLRNGFTAYIVLSPARPGLLVTVARAMRSIIASLTPATGASGPHDFTVRTTIARLAILSRPPLPVPTSVTMANAPS